MDSRLRASPEQFSLLIEFMESHGDLSRSQVGLQGRVRSERLWQELGDILNSVGRCGVNKTSDKWKRVWSDWKTKTKKKASLINRDIHGTGGGSGRGKPLSRLEERVLRVIGVTAITGSQAIQEAGFQEPSQPQVSNTADTAGRMSSPAEIELLALPSAAEDTPIAVPANVTSPPAHPVSPVPGPSNSRTIQGERSPVSAGPSTPRHRHLRQRRLRQTPFDRATSEFVAIEENRLRFERERDVRQHELETERLKIEAQRLQLDRERVRVEEVRTHVEADLRDYIQELNLKITLLCHYWRLVI
ncbi:unnamed protein product [Parnassius apollo]|uniref:Regulatory protein zeste n=1 Tax=Parnassius apollo TaxID=110799 RepID=A0A8S3WKR3_PARAO|nr:unnamed protein product [Parnassius apollo]